MRLTYFGKNVIMYNTIIGELYMTETILYIFSILLKVGIIPTAVLIYKKKIKFINGLFVGTFLFLASFGCQVYSANIMYGYSMIDNVVNAVFDEMKSVYSSSQGLTAEDAAMIGQAIDAVKDVYFAILPTILVCTNLVWVYILLMVSKGIFALCKRDVSGFMKFCDFRMSKFGVLMGAAAYIISVLSGDGRLSYAFLNFTMILLFAAAVCGLSAIDFKFRRVLKSSIVRFVIYFIAVFLTVLAMGIGFGLLVFWGIYDAFFNIREPRNRLPKQE